MSQKCQRCKHPIIIHDSLFDPSPSTYDLLTSAASKSQSTSSPSLSSSQVRIEEERRALYEQAMREAGGGGRGEDAKRSLVHPGESYVMLTQSQFTPPLLHSSSSPQPSSSDATRTKEMDRGTLSHQISVSNKLFAIVSARTDIDHPLCADCADLLLEAMDRQLTEAGRERDAYISFLKQLKAQQGDVDVEKEREKEKDLERIRREHGDAVRELKELEDERAELEDELKGLDIEDAELRKEETAFTHQLNATQDVLTQHLAELSHLEHQHAKAQQTLKLLESTNTWTDIFTIKKEGQYGTINGLRLGKLPTSTRNQDPPDWSEINAAFGWIVLLFDSINRALLDEPDTTWHGFKGVELHPLGSRSCVTRWSTGEEGKGGKRERLELFSDSAISRIFTFRRFDTGMIALLSAIQQIMLHLLLTSLNHPSAPSSAAIPRPPPSTPEEYAGLALGHDPSLPWEIENDRIWKLEAGKRSGSGWSIRLAFNQEESWTVALKGVLTIGKWCLGRMEGRVGVSK
ncbi:Vacuolar protein sorting-associated protein atg6 [Saitoella coloradoensis]